MVDFTNPSKLIDAATSQFKKGTDRLDFSKMDEQVYSIKDKETNWYVSLPYGFEVTLKDGKSAVQYLPISPNNITIQTHMATNVVTTLYGVVEEHSEIRYHDITIQGTTGYMPKYTAHELLPDKKGAPSKSLASSFLDKAKSAATQFFTPRDNKSSGRQSAQGNESPAVSEVFAAFPKTANILKSTKDLLTGGDDLRMGVDLSKTGYIAFHNLQRMFHLYKKDASSTGKRTTPTRPIQFLNQKDGVRYDCAPIQFSVVRSAESPMLYNYSITFRAYNMRSIDLSPDYESINKLEELGLSGFGNSLMKTVKGAASAAMGAIGGLKSLSKGLGR